MSYLTQDEIASSPSMQARVAQAAVGEQPLPIGYTPDQWANVYRREWAAAPDWDAAWESAQAAHPDDPTYDPGTNEAAITDGMILSQVQAMVTAQNGESGAPAGQ